MSYPVEQNGFHYDLQAAAAALFVPYISEAINQKHYWEKTGKPGPQGPTVAKDTYAAVLNPFLDALANGDYAVQDGQLVQNGATYVDNQAFLLLAHALGIPEQTVYDALSKDVADNLAGNAAAGWKKIWHYFGAIPDDVKIEDWYAGDDADSWAAEHGHGGPAPAGGGAKEAAGGGTLPWIVLGLGATWALSKVV